MYAIFVLKLQVVEASSLSWGTRIKGFIACFAVGILCSLLVRRVPSILPDSPLYSFPFACFSLCRVREQGEGRWGGQLCGSGGRGIAVLTCPVLPLLGYFPAVGAQERTDPLCGVLHLGEHGINWEVTFTFSPFSNLAVYWMIKCPSYLREEGEEGCFVPLRS